MTQMTHTPEYLIGWLKATAVLHGHDSRKGRLCDETVELIKKLMEENERLRQSSGKNP